MVLVQSALTRKRQLNLAQLFKAGEREGAGNRVALATPQLLSFNRRYATTFQ
jgi:hypothetical protein